MRTAICPGSFDPITLGHMDVIERAAALFDRVVVCVMINGGKDTGMFPAQRRLEFVRLATEHLPNVDTARWDGLLAEFARREGACALVKGVRNGSDFDWEYQMACINRQLEPGLDTVLLPAAAERVYFSSTMAREMIKYGQDLYCCLPAPVARILMKGKD